MPATGYKYVNLDDGWWQGDRETNGNIVVDENPWPGGMKTIADHIHSKGLKAGTHREKNTNVNPTQAEIWDLDCAGGRNQIFQQTALSELVVYGNKCLDADNNGQADLARRCPEWGHRERSRPFRSSSHPLRVRGRRVAPAGTGR
nr:alpha-galactosidase [Streptomyces griseus]